MRTENIEQVCRYIHLILWKSSYWPIGALESNTDMSRGRDNKAISWRRVCVCGESDERRTTREEGGKKRGKDKESGREKEWSRCCTLVVSLFFPLWPGVMEG